MSAVSPNQSSCDVRHNCCKAVERLRLAVEAAHLGVYEFRPLTGEVIYSPACRRMLDLPDSPDASAIFATRVDPEVRERLHREVIEACQPQQAAIGYQTEFPYHWPPGQTRWIEGRGRAFFEPDDAGQVVTRVIGFVNDITARKQAETELRHQKEVLERIFENIPAMIALMDSSGRVVLVNRELERVLGWSNQDWRSSDPARQCYPDRVVRGAVQAHIAAADGTWKAFPARTHDGRDCMISWANVRLSDGSLLSIGQDVTDRLHAEDRLRASEDLLSRVIESTADGILVIGSTGLVTLANAAAETILGRPRAQLLGRPWAPPGWMTPVAAHRADEEDNPDRTDARVLGRGESVIGVERALTRPDGSTVTLLANAVPLRDAHGTITGMVSSFTDITERKTASETLRALSRRLIDVQEQERRHIARELHDEIGQLLTALRFSLDAAESGRAGALQEARRLVTDLTIQVRDLSLRLRPSLLDDLGLLPALVWHLERYTSQTGIQVALFQHGLEGQRFSSDVETAAYRIVQEALTNIARYAGVTAAEVRLWWTSENLVVEVEDRGQGFDAAAALAQGRTSGLSGMRERAELLGGRWRVCSTPSGGTCVRAELPVGTMKGDEHGGESNNSVGG